MVTHTSTRLQLALWITQITLALVFAIAGASKTFLAPADLFAMLPDLASMPLALVRIIGIAELAAAVGLLLPSATRIAPVLTPIAASGLAVVVLLAFAFHVREGHTEKLPVVIALAALSAFVAWGRFLRAPVAKGDGNRVPRLNLGPGGQS
jgi:uncharacterized membrane protein